MNCLKLSFLKKSFFFNCATFVILFFCTFNSYAEKYRHINVNKNRESYFYVSVGLGIPLSNSIKNVSQIFPANTSEIYENSNRTMGNTETFPADKIKALAGLGYKSPYFLRLEANLDFQTFARKFYPTSITTSGYSQAIIMIRQFSFIVNSYFDLLPNKAFVVPYVGAGAGVSSFTGSIVFPNNTNNNLNFNITDKYQQSRSKFAFIYEVNAGLRFGDKVATFSIEAFERRTFGNFEVFTRGVVLKASFQI